MWYVVVDPNCFYPNPNELVWTISRDPNETGWETDCGHNGYGLTKADAEELANAANEIERLREVLRIEIEGSTHAWAERNKCKDEIERLREALLPFTRLTVDNEVLEEWERKHPAFAQLVKNARAALKGDE